MLVHALVLIHDTVDCMNDLDCLANLLGIKLISSNKEGNPTWWFSTERVGNTLLLVVVLIIK